MIKSLIEKNWFTSSLYEQIISHIDKLDNKVDIYSMILATESNSNFLEPLKNIFSNLITNNKIKEEKIQLSFSKSTEKNQYLIEKLFLSEQDSNKAIDYAMKYEASKGVNDAVIFINQTLDQHFNGFKPLDSEKVCLIIARCFIFRVSDSNFCDTIVNLLELIKKEDNNLYMQVNEKITSTEKISIYCVDGKERSLMFDSKDFQDFLTTQLFNSLSVELNNGENKIVSRKIKI